MAMPVSPHDLSQANIPDMLIELINRHLENDWGGGAPLTVYVSKDKAVLRAIVSMYSAMGWKVTSDENGNCSFGYEFGGLDGRA